jgi:hypothetical protein
MNKFTAQCKFFIENDKIDQNQCSLCNNIIIKPISICSNSHKFCFDCIKNHFETYRTCPIISCNHQFNSTVRFDELWKFHKEHDQEIYALKRKCCFDDCSWTGTQNEFCSHYEICEYRTVLCPKCNLYYPIGKYQYHYEGCSCLMCVYCNHIVYNKPDHEFGADRKVHLKNKQTYEIKQIMNLQTQLLQSLITEIASLKIQINELKNK